MSDNLLVRILLIIQLTDTTKANTALVAEVMEQKETSEGHWSSVHAPASCVHTLVFYNHILHNLYNYINLYSMCLYQLGLQLKRSRYSFWSRRSRQDRKGCWHWM